MQASFEIYGLSGVAPASRVAPVDGIVHDRGVVNSDVCKLSWCQCECVLATILFSLLQFKYISALTSYVCGKV